ncbi:hypothetical protein CMUS01_03205 [Colletotrichum musicola]|uniref:Uncharacterized protein n=1 Tax=Colletotrichum musicola TaxID=2175873 RepID=A0A8H6NTL4_9PEZI|nr:hypothetical protein CMUS01_03205 [Colletotrichum musicola]
MSAFANEPVKCTRCLSAGLHVFESEWAITVSSVLLLLLLARPSRSHTYRPVVMSGTDTVVVAAAVRDPGRQQTRSANDPRHLWLDGGHDDSNDVVAALWAWTSWEFGGRRSRMVVPAQQRASMSHACMAIMVHGNLMQPGHCSSSRRHGKTLPPRSWEWETLPGGRCTLRCISDRQFIIRPRTKPSAYKSHIADRTRAKYYAAQPTMLQGQGRESASSPRKTGLASPQPAANHVLRDGQSPSTPPRQWRIVNVYTRFAYRTDVGLVAHVLRFDSPAAAAAAAAVTNYRAHGVLRVCWTSGCPVLSAHSTQAQPRPAQSMRPNRVAIVDPSMASAIIH